MSEELYFNNELRKCLNAAGLSDCGENDAWNYWYQRVHKAHDQTIDRMTEVQRVENAKLRERADNLLNAVFAKNNELFDLLCENEKLRQLVRDMGELLDVLTECDLACRHYCDGCIGDCYYVNARRELGVEVDG